MFASQDKTATLNAKQRYTSPGSSHTASSPGVAPWSRGRYGIGNSRIAWRCGTVANENGDALQIAAFVKFLGKNVRLAISCQKPFSRLYQRHMATNHRWKVRGNYNCLLRVHLGEC